MATHSAPASLAEARFLRDELTDIAQRAQTFTSASGSVITMLRDDKLIVCARAGTAPETGVQIPVAGSLAGRAIQSGRTMRCSEAETEATVDLAALRPLRVRAMAVIPLGSVKSAIRGALIVLSESTSAFNNTQLAILRTLADLASEKLQQGNVPVPPAPPWAPATMAVPAEPRPSLVVPAAPAPVAAPAPAAPACSPVKPSASLAAAASVAPAPRPSLAAPPLPASAVEPEAGKQDEPLVEPLAAALTPIRIAPAPRPSAGKPPAAPMPSSRANGIFTVPKIELPPRKPAVPRIAIPAGIVVTVVIAGALWAYRGTGHEAAPPVPHYVAVPISQVPGADQPAPVTATAPAEPPAATTPQPAVTKAPEPAKPTEVASVHNESKPAAKIEAAKEPNKPATSKHEASGMEAVTVDQPIRRPAAVEPHAEAPVLAPALNLVAGNKAPELPTAKVPLPARPEPKLAPAELIRRVSPTYPPAARQSGLQGTVVLRVGISAQGQVSSVAVVSGAPLLAGAAAEAVKQWRYKPALLNGSPVESLTEIVLNFKLSK